MATAMHLCGVRTPHPAFPRRQLITSWNCPGSLVSGLCSRIVENPRGGRVVRVSCEKRSDDGLEWSKPLNQPTSVMNFGASSVASAERMREVAELIRSFPEERPVIFLSSMGETTNNLLQAGENAIICGPSNVSDIEELSFVKELHLRTADELGVDRSVVSTLLEDLMRLLKVIAQVKELTLSTKAYLVSFGECMSTRIFAAYLNKVGTKARQYDAFDIGFITTDDFTNAHILVATYPAVAERLRSDWVNDPAIPVITGSLGKGLRSGAITALGSSGSALTATTIAKALGLREIKVLHPQSIGPAREGDIPVRIENSYNPKAPGTVITRAQDMIKAVLSSTVFRIMVTLLYYLSGVMVDQLDKHPSNLWSRGLIYQLASGLFVVLTVIRGYFVLFPTAMESVDGGNSTLICSIQTPIYFRASTFREVDNSEGKRDYDRDKADGKPSYNHVTTWKVPSWEWKGMTFEQVFPDTDQGSLVTIALALRSLVARALGGLVTGARDLFKAVLSNKALNEFATMFFCVSTFALAQLKNDAYEKLEEDLTGLEKRLYNALWRTKYSCLLFLIVSLYANGGMSLVINWIATLKDGGTTAFMELLKRLVVPSSNDRNKPVDDGDPA